MKKKSSAIKTLGAVTDLGIDLHTALRKCCDSPPTTLAYNLISMDAFTEVWADYLKLVVGFNEPVTVAKLKAAAARIPYGTAERNALRCTFELFDDDDWNGFIYFALKTEEDK